MDYIIRYVGEVNSVIMTTSGSIIPERVKDLIDAEVEMLIEHPEANLIYDQSNSTAEEITGDDIWKIAQDSARLSELLTGRKMAVVLLEDLEFGLGRMWKSFTEAKVPFEIQLFRDVEAAKEWVLKPAEEKVATE
jgi:hypothetical protein